MQEHVRKLARTGRAGRALVGAALSVSAAVGLAGLGAGAAGAATHKTSKAASASLKSLESKLSALERAYPSGTTLTEAGSSLVYPLMVEWEGHGLAAGLSPAAGGSGKGQAGAEGGTLDLGGSDPYLPDSTLQQYGALNVPLVVSAQDVFYNIPGLAQRTHLKLNGKVLDGMYSGTIKTWNAPAIKKLNPGVKIPAVKVVPVHRVDSSGDTFLFTSYLYGQDPSGIAASGPTQLETWPNVPGALSANGNGGVQATCEATPGCVAYIGVSYIRGSLKGGLGYAALQNGYNRKGGPQFVLPDATTIANEVASYKNMPASGGLSLINAHNAKNGFPIVNFEYVIVKKNSSKPAAVKAFLAWAMDPRGGATGPYLQPLVFQPLPLNALQVAINLVNQIH